MKQKIYRNIFVQDNSLPNEGLNTAYYSGQLYFNAENIKNINELYNKDLDLYITCNECARKKYKQFTKIYRY